MRRSTRVYAPILAYAALTLTIGPRATAQQPLAAAQLSAATTREGFGASFFEHPRWWVFGATYAGCMIFGSGS